MYNLKKAEGGGCGGGGGGGGGGSKGFWIVKYVKIIVTLEVGLFKSWHVTRAVDHLMWWQNKTKKTGVWKLKCEDNTLEVGVYKSFKLTCNSCSLSLKVVKKQNKTKNPLGSGNWNVRIKHLKLRYISPLNWHVTHAVYYLMWWQKQNNNNKKKKMHRGLETKNDDNTLELGYISPLNWRVTRAFYHLTWWQKQNKTPKNHGCLETKLWG